jgi:hypothetical protein
MRLTYTVQSELIGTPPNAYPAFLTVPEITFWQVHQVTSTTWRVTSDESTLHTLTDAGVTIIPEVNE